MNTTKKALLEQKKQEAVQKLRDFIVPTEGVLVIVKSVSKSGMSRKMDVYTRDADLFLNYLIADACGLSMKDESLVVHGVGMDMRFWLVDLISHVIYSEEERNTLTGNGSGCLPWKSL